MAPFGGITSRGNRKCASDTKLVESRMRRFREIVQRRHNAKRLAHQCVAILASINAELVGLENFGEELSSDGSGSSFKDRDSDVAETSEDSEEEEQDKALSELSSQHDVQIPPSPSTETDYEPEIPAENWPYRRREFKDELALSVHGLYEFQRQKDATKTRLKWSFRQAAYVGKERLRKIEELEKRRCLFRSLGLHSMIKERYRQRVLKGLPFKPEYYQQQKKEDLDEVLHHRSHQLLEMNTRSSEMIGDTRHRDAEHAYFGFVEGCIDDKANLKRVSFVSTDGCVQAAPGNAQVTFVFTDGCVEG